MRNLNDGERNNLNRGADPTVSQVQQERYRGPRQGGRGSKIAEPSFEHLAIMARWRMALSQVRYLNVQSADLIIDDQNTLGIHAVSTLSRKGTMIDIGRLFREFVMVSGDQASETWSEDANGFVFRFRLIKPSGASVDGSVHVTALP